MTTTEYEQTEAELMYELFGSDVEDDLSIPEESDFEFDDLVSEDDSENEPILPPKVEEVKSKKVKSKANILNKLLDDTLKKVIKENFKAINDEKFTYKDLKKEFKKAKIPKEFYKKKKDNIFGVKLPKFIEQRRKQIIREHKKARTEMIERRKRMLKRK